MARVRVLHAIQNLNYGGMERLFADIVRLLDSDRFESHVLIMDYLGRFGEGLDRYATIHHSVPLGRWSMVHPGPLTAQIRGIAPDIVHTHAGVWFKVSLAARRAGVRRIIHTEHGRKSPDPWLDRTIGRLASRRTDVVVAVSQALAAHLQRRVVAYPGRVLTIPNGVDTSLYSPRPDLGTLRKELGVGSDIPILGSIGRLEPIKGYDLMVEAFALLRQSWRGSQLPVLLIAGEGSERPLLESSIREHGLTDCVHLLGWRDDTANLHSAFTLFTMSSRSEGTSISLLEAMSSGLAPVVTDVGGNAAVLGEELKSNLVTPLDAKALADKWRAVLTTPGLLERQGAAARQRVCADFSLDVMVKEYERQYVGERA